jgi:hypothetical protein
LICSANIDQLLESNIYYFPLTEFITRDLVSAIIDIPMERGTQKTVITSVYMAPDERDPSSLELLALIDYCQKSNTQIIIGCDANAHHIVWGSSDTNDKGESLLEFINTKKLEIRNRGNIVTCRHDSLKKEEVIDLTLSSPFIRSKIKDLHVPSEPSLSDHRHICFRFEAEKTVKVSSRIMKKTD